MSTDPTTGAESMAHPHGPGADPVLGEVEDHVDPAVASAVHEVRDRFGAAGLRDIITLATYELEVVEQAMAQLREEVVEDDQPFDQLADDPQGGSAHGSSGATRTGDAGAR